MPRSQTSFDAYYLNFAENIPLCISEPNTSNVQKLYNLTYTVLLRITRQLANADRAHPPPQRQKSGKGRAVPVKAPSGRVMPGGGVRDVISCEAGSVIYYLGESLPGILGGALLSLRLGFRPLRFAWHPRRNLAAPSLDL